MRKVSHVMVRRIRLEHDRAMEPVALSDFLDELYGSIGSGPCVADIVYIVGHRADRFAMNSNLRITLTAEFAYSALEWAIWRQGLWPETRRQLSPPEIAALCRVMTGVLRPAEDRMLRYDVFYFSVREAFSRSWWPPSWEEFLCVINANKDRYIEDRFGYVRLAAKFISSADEWAPWEQAS